MKALHRCPNVLPRVISKTMAPQGIGSALRPIAFVFWEINKKLPKKKTKNHHNLNSPKKKIKYTHRDNVPQGLEQTQII